ncbi:hypothetical protein B0I26_102270 [Anoxybacillus vitaminiphilus]|uniref:Uncharacterized protein n=1 Tax=Paranoxybacillus vitaminiphilus TaxID=581036 RepID=A0A327YMV1_9BACL|nr:hypothetical protein [Anoxybacillus vitaminiphilus]RAK22278.1 hypothetical protein B0I26_102270 [Anoxybacillus vitaminiphilus]
MNSVLLMSLIVLFELGSALAAGLRQDDWTIVLFGMIGVVFLFRFICVCIATFS